MLLDNMKLDAFEYLEPKNVLMTFPREVTYIYIYFHCYTVKMQLIVKVSTMYIVVYYTTYMLNTNINILYCPLRPPHLLQHYKLSNHLWPSLANQTSAL